MYSANKLHCRNSLTSTQFGHGVFKMIAMKPVSPFLDHPVYRGPRLSTGQQQCVSSFVEATQHCSHKYVIRHRQIILPRDDGPMTALQWGTESLCLSCMAYTSCTVDAICPVNIQQSDSNAASPVTGLLADCMASQRQHSLVQTTR